jgi:hypothetical protein
MTEPYASHDASEIEPPCFFLITDSFFEISRLEPHGSFGGVHG